MDRKEQAVMLHHHGFNCAQSVACTFCNVMGADPETTFRLAEPLGFGMGIERIAMLKYGINHMGKLFENDIEFLKQFKA